MFWKSFNVPLAYLSVPATLQFSDTHQLGDFFVLDVSRRQSIRGCLRRRDRDRKKKKHRHVDCVRSGVLSDPGRRRRRNSRL